MDADSVTSCLGHTALSWSVVRLHGPACLPARAATVYLGTEGPRAGRGWPQVLSDPDVLKAVDPEYEGSFELLPAPVRPVCVVMTVAAFRFPPALACPLTLFRSAPLLVSLGWRGPISRRSAGRGPDPAAAGVPPPRCCRCPRGQAGADHVGAVRAVGGGPAQRAGATSKPSHAAAALALSQGIRVYVRTYVSGCMCVYVGLCVWACMHGSLSVCVWRCMQPPLEVAMRVDAAKSVRGTVLLYGFLIEAVGTPRHSCQVTCVSQMGTSVHVCR
jgi:hypothetical protein